MSARASMTRGHAISGVSRISPSRIANARWLMRATGPLHRLIERVDHLARFVFRGRDHNLGRDVPELTDVVALDVLKLNLQHARLRPLAVLAELHVADDGLERVGAQINGKLCVVEALGRADRLAQNLELSVAPRTDVIAERIDAFARRPRLILLHEVG